MTNKSPTIRAVAIDDEPIALDIIKMYAEKVPFLQLEGSFVNAIEAINYLNTKDVDLLFLDIKMPDISGIDFYHSLVRKPFLVFTTAYSEHAVTGFELEAMDYLLKPFAFPRFLKACNKVQEIIQNRRDVPNYIFLKDGYETVRIGLQDIRFIEATGNYMKYVLGDRELLTRATIKETLELFPSPPFLQVHRSFIVNREHVDKIDRNRLHIGEHDIPVGMSFVSAVKEAFQ